MMIHFDHRYIKAVMADRQREAQTLRLNRLVRQARSQKRNTEGQRRWRFILRDPLKA